jgi:hypothetical protein
MFSKKKIRNYPSRSWPNLWLLVESALWLVSIKFGLHIFRFQTLREILSIASLMRRFSGEPAQDSLERVVWSIEKSSCYLPRSINCLPRALAAQVMLTQRGHDVEVIIGARRNQQRRLNAHAWVEHQGKVIIGNMKDLSQYSPLKNAEVYEL